MSQVVLSGIRATGRLHFGNFLGAVRHFVEYERAGHDCLYFIADLHTLTTLKDPEEMRKHILEITKDYLATGLNPETSVIYAQSNVPELSELCLLLSMVQPLGDLQRIPTFKEKVRKHPDDVNLGLVTYPVLMAADILGPKATLVPVGEDQTPNIELVRSLARRFNERYGQTFDIPRYTTDMVKVPGLDGTKMGKSDADNAIDISLSMKEIGDLYKKKGQTDPLRIHADDPGSPYDRCRSVYPLHELITPGEKETTRIANKCIRGQIGCSACKDILIESITRVLEPFQARRAELADEDNFVQEILHEGAKKARARIQATVAEVRDRMGITIY
jgi:tryptophanyl-tRNA synthetase